jgi:hypothetical protein
MSKTILKPIQKIRFIALNTSPSYFEIECLGGRIKWFDTNETVALKFQVHETAIGLSNLNSLESEAAHFKFEVISENIDGSLRETHFEDFEIERLELRSISSDGVYQYFIEGRAEQPRILTA